MVSRSETGELVVVEIPSSNEGHPDRKLTGTLQAILGSNLTFVSDTEIDVASAARVQSKDFLFMGRVSACVPSPQGRWAVCLDVKRKMLIL